MKMKTHELLQKVYILGLILLTISCNTDESSDSNSNSIPAFYNQEFTVSEDLGGRQTIGILEATDADNDTLTFRLMSDIDLLIDQSTGEIKTTRNSILDYETETTLNFNVSVKDNNGGQKTATITINVLDVDDGPLTNLQKSFVNEYMFLTYWWSPDAKGGISHSIKWQNEVKLFMEGEISTDYEQRIQSYLEELNALMTDGTTLTLVSSLEESNIHLISGPPSSIQHIWPGIYNLIKDGTFTGWGFYDLNTENYISEGLIWVSNSNSSLFIHELGHVLGFGHQSIQLCGDGEISFMCSQAAASEFNTFDAEIIKALYNSGTSVGLTTTEMRLLIEEYVIENSILQ